MLGNILQAWKDILAKRRGTASPTRVERQKQYAPLVTQLHSVFAERNTTARADTAYDVAFAQQFLSAKFERLAELTRACFGQPKLWQDRENLFRIYKRHIEDYVREHPAFKQDCPHFFNTLVDKQQALVVAMKNSWSSTIACSS